MSPDFFIHGSQFSLAALQTERHGGVVCRLGAHGGKYNEQRNSCRTDEQFDWIMGVN